MARFGVVLAVVALALTIFTLVDIGLTDSRRARGVPKAVWFLIALLPIIGLILWFAVGKGPAGAARVVTVAPDDDPSFLRNLRRDEEQDERIRRLEQELADLDDDPPADK
jgi:hypothetical protein